MRPEVTKAGGAWGKVPEALGLPGRPSPGALSSHTPRSRQSTERESSSCAQGSRCPRPCWPGACRLAIHRFVGKSNTALLGAGVSGALSDQNVKNEHHTTLQACQGDGPAQDRCSPRPLLHARGQLLPGAQSPQSAWAGTPLPGREDFLRQSNFASWLQDQLPWPLGS